MNYKLVLDWKTKICDHILTKNFAWEKCPKLACKKNFQINVFFYIKNRDNNLMKGVLPIIIVDKKEGKNNFVL